MTHSDSHKRATTKASESAHQDRVRIVDLMYDLEAALAAPSFSRSEEWCQRVLKQLKMLEDVLHTSREEINSKEGLFAEILEESPWLLPRVEELKRVYREVEAEIARIRGQLEAQPQSADQVGGMRRQLGALLMRLRDVQAKENELIFEAIGVDLGVGD